MIPWPPEPLGMDDSQVIRGYLRLEDRMYEHNSAKNHKPRRIAKDGLTPKNWELTGIV